MRVLFFVWVLSFCMTSCAQNNTTMQTNNITANNFIQRMKEEVKLYEDQPMYLLRINQEYCTYEVLVNGFPVYENYDLGVSATGTKINMAILKSGEQTVTLRMYPLGDLEQETYGDDEPYYDTLKGGSSMRIEVVKVPDWKNYDIAGEEIIKVVTTEGVDTNKFPGAGLPYYEFSFTFTAEVPYENEGWSNGVDLRKIDSTILHKKIWDYFKMYQKIYEDKDKDKFFQINFKKTTREVTANYFAHRSHDGETIYEELKEQYIEDIMIKEKDFLPLKDYELAFYCDGRVVTFKQSSSHKTDSRLRGSSALHFLYREDGEEFRRIISPYIYVYIDKDKYNSKEEDIQLEMIK